MSGAIGKLVVAVILGLAMTAPPVAAQEIRIEPIPPHVKPQWAPVPNAPGVFWAPNIPTDVFRHGTKYYFYWSGYLYQGKKPQGPWKGMTKVPAWFPQIDFSYFKTLPKQQTAAPPAPSGEPQEEIVPIPTAPAPAPAPAPEQEKAPPAPGETGKAPEVM